MKKITFSVVLFVVLSCIAGLFAGAFASPLFMPENPGLVGGAIVVICAGVGMILGLIAGLVFWRFLKTSQLRVFNQILGIGCLGVVLWLTYRYISRPKASGEVRSEMPNISKPAPPAPSTVPPIGPDPVLEDAVSIGLGMGKPIMEPGQVIYFYESAKSEIPSDSLIFKEGPYHLIIDESSSPVYPEHLKLDYQICFFLVKSKANKRLEVVLNKQNGQTAWVRQEQTDLLPWPMFLTTIHSVEPLDWSTNPVRMSPNNEADVVPNISPGHILEAKSRSGDWLNVVISDENYQTLGRGWVRWRENGTLVLRYNLLS